LLFFPIILLPWKKFDQKLNPQLHSTGAIDQTIFLATLHCSECKSRRPFFSQLHHPSLFPVSFSSLFTVTFNRLNCPATYIAFFHSKSPIPTPIAQISMSSRSFLSNLSHKSHPKVKFTPTEDELLAAAVQELGTKNWDEIATRVSGRNSRQCRDRWSNYLSPTVGNGPWTSQEEAFLVEMVGKLGSSWKRIATFFPSRTDINVKSHWQLMQRRMKKRPGFSIPPPYLPEPLPLPVPQTEPLPFLVPLPQTNKTSEPQAPTNDPDLFQSLMMNEDGGYEGYFENWL
jgi:hypothetical protein